MVARINTGKNISKALNYNEQKVQRKEAECLHAHHFSKDTGDLNFYDKLRHFKKLIDLNERTSTNTLHVSLNFDPSEKITSEKIIEVAKTYMTKIGFGNQPYLVYRHFDAGHPHIHIVSTNVQRDGTRISMHNLGRNQSEKARKEIEMEFGLVKAEGKKVSDAMNLQPVNVQKVIYGKLETKRAIANVIRLVIDQYKYSSLPELNAVLKLYNVTADRGSENSRTYQQNGLTYRVLDEMGNKVGAPIKASAFYMKPTLQLLQKKFAENEPLKQPHVKRLKTAIDFALIRQKEHSLDNLIKSLGKDRISVVIRENKDGFIYGITYVDHQTKTVFNGSDLGKQYSARAIQERCTEQNQNVSNSMTVEKKIHQPLMQPADQSTVSLPDQKKDILEVLTAIEKSTSYIPYHLKNRKKKKRKRLSI